METIRLTTWIDAPVERCFRLAASVERHVASTAVRGDDEAGAKDGGGIVRGVNGGLGARVTGSGEVGKFQRLHVDVRLTHTSRIVGWRPYGYFFDVMVKGAFARFEHEHHFAAMDDGTRMRDEIRFAARFGLLGRMVEKTVVRRNLIKLLKRRNAVIKRVAETDEWREYLEPVGEPGTAERAGEERVVRGWDTVGAESL